MRGRLLLLLFFCRLGAPGAGTCESSLEIIRPSGGDPAPASNPPIVELLITGEHVIADSIQLTIDGLHAALDPESDGLDNDGDELIDEDGEQTTTWPAMGTTRMCAKWPWSLRSDDPATFNANEGIHVLKVEIGISGAGVLVSELNFAIYSSGDLDSLIVFPSPFDPGKEMARIGCRVLTKALLRIDVLDFQARVVTEISDWTEHQPGWHQNLAVWDGRDDRGLIVGNGVYFVRVKFKNELARNERIEKCFVSH